MHGNTIRNRKLNTSILSHDQKPQQNAEGEKNNYENKTLLSATGVHGVLAHRTEHRAPAAADAFARERLAASCSVDREDWLRVRRIFLVLVPSVSLGTRSAEPSNWNIQLEYPCKLKLRVQCVMIRCKAVADLGDKSVQFSSASGSAQSKQAHGMGRCTSVGVQDRLLLRSTDLAVGLNHDPRAQRASAHTRL